MHTATPVERPSAGSAPVEAPVPPTWGALGLFLVSSLYVWSGVWLVAFVALPTVFLDLTPTVITSGSMSPLIGTGDIVLLRDTGTDALAPGTVIAFDDPARPGTQTLHRIVDVHPDGSYRTKGDANAVPDSTPVPPDRITGAGALLIPYVGLPVLWLRTGSAFFLLWLVVTGASLLLAVDMPRDEPSAPPPRGRVRSAIEAAGTRAAAGGRLERTRRPVVRTAPPSGRDDGDDRAARG